MNRPPATDYAFGHRAAVWLATGTTILTTLAWLGHSVSWLVPLVALAARNGCLSARARVTRYEAWTTAWNEMAGAGQGEPGLTPSSPRTPPAASSQSAEPRPARRNRLPRSVPVTAWLLIVAWFTVRRNTAQTPGDGVLALLLIALSIWGAFAAVTSLARRVLRAPAPPPARSAAEPEPAFEDVVTQCLGVPPAPDRSGRRIFDLLPSYARALLTRSRAPRSSTIPHPNTESEQSP